MIAKALNYAQFRNKMAHGLFHPNKLNADGDPIEWRIKESSSWQSAAGLDVVDLHVAAENFSDFAQIIFGALQIRFTQKPLAEYLEQLERLPNEATSSQLSQKQLGRRRQQEAAERSRRRRPPDPVQAKRPGRTDAQ